jgi:PTK7 protein tyrosine kinase 7
MMALRLPLVTLVFVAFFAAVTKSKTQDNFYFDPAPMDADAVEGGEVRLRCDVSNRKMIRFYWTLNGRRLANDSRRFQEDSDLRILRVDRNQDLGSYRCIATNVTTGISVTSTEARLNMQCEYPLTFAPACSSIC